MLQYIDNEVEVIVSDGGSTDSTRDILEDLRTDQRVKIISGALEMCLPCHWSWQLRPFIHVIRIFISGGRSRAESQNIGALEAKEDSKILLFLHADSILPHNYGRMVRDMLGSAPSCCLC